MRSVICLSFIVIFFYSNKLISQEQDSLFAKSDSLGVLSAGDTTSKESDSLSLTVLPKEMDTKRRDKIKIVRRNFSYRTQIGAALFMMGLVVLILTSVDNWNPN